MPGPLPAALLAGAVAAAGQRVRVLTADGALAATAVGTAVLAAAGWGLALLLAIFFSTASALTRIRAADKPQPEHRRGRSASQVAANGLVPALLALGHAILSLPWALPAAAGALAASTADTWATEMGLLSPRRPRLITTWRRVPPGTSGGVTLLGTTAGAAGALLIALAGGPTVGGSPTVVLGAGLAGLVADSLLGATLQVRYRCPVCREEGEDRRCTCGALRARTSGLAWITNDVVNLAAAVVGAAVVGALRGS